MNEPQTALTWLIGDLLSRHDDPRLKNVSIDGDHEDAETIVTWDDGEVTCDFVVKPRRIDPD